ncbi:50S ribosomal protein L11 methyltransferase [soil metagenome]
MPEAPKSWYAVDVIADVAAAEAVEFAFNLLDSLGTEIDSLGKQPGEPLCVTGFFDAPPDTEAVRIAVAESFRIHCVTTNALVSISLRTVEETDWLAEWKKHWKPQDVGRFTIAPSWSDVATSDRIIIRIEPNMAFGTGTHETTQLCLNAISELYLPDQSFLDVGTGTGILAIAAAKLGGRSILACDVDRDSVAIARENAVTNSVSERIEFADGPITGETAMYDFVCANLTLDVIIPMLPLLADKTRKTLLLSGILAEQEPLAIDAIKKLVFKDLRIDRAGEWISIIAYPARSV